MNSAQFGVIRKRLFGTFWSCHLRNDALVFLRAKAAYCFQRVLAIAILSVRLSVCLSVRLSHGWISQKRYKLDC